MSHPFEDETPDEPVAANGGTDVMQFVPVDYGTGPMFGRPSQEQLLDARAKMLENSLFTSMRSAESENLGEISKMLAMSDRVNAEAWIDAYTNLKHRMALIFEPGMQGAITEEQVAEIMEETDILKLWGAYAMGGVKAVNAMEEQMHAQVMKDNVERELNGLMMEVAKEKKEESAKRRRDMGISAKRGRMTVEEEEEQERLDQMRKNAATARKLASLYASLGIALVRSTDQVALEEDSRSSDDEMMIGMKASLQRKLSKNSAAIVMPSPKRKDAPVVDALKLSVQEARALEKEVRKRRPAVTDEAIIALLQKLQDEDTLAAQEDAVIGFFDVLVRKTDPSYFNMFTTEEVHKEEEVPEEVLATYEGFSGWIRRGWDTLRNAAGRAVVDVVTLDEEMPELTRKRMLRDAQKARMEQKRKVQDALSVAQADDKAMAARTDMSEEQRVHAELARAGRLIFALSAVAGLATLGHRVVYGPTEAMELKQLDNEASGVKEQADDMRKMAAEMRRGDLKELEDPVGYEDWVRAAGEAERKKLMEETVVNLRGQVQKLEAKAASAQTARPDFPTAGQAELSRAEKLRGFLESAPDSPDTSTFERDKEFLDIAREAFTDRDLVKDAANYLDEQANKLDHLADRMGQIRTGLEGQMRKDVVASGIEVYLKKHFGLIGSAAGFFVGRTWGGIEIFLRSWTNLGSWVGTASFGLAGAAVLGGGLFSWFKGQPPGPIMDAGIKGVTLLGYVLSGNFVLAFTAAAGLGWGKQALAQVDDAVMFIAKWMDRKLSGSENGGSNFVQRTVTSLRNSGVLAFQGYMTYLSISAIMQLIGALLVALTNPIFLAAGALGVAFALIVICYRTGASVTMLPTYVASFYIAHPEAIMYTALTIQMILLSVSYWTQETEKADSSYMDTEGIGGGESLYEVDAGTVVVNAEARVNNRVTNYAIEMIDTNIAKDADFVRNQYATSSILK